ncbi:hypothetical protein PoB_001684900 [Plakobranchus ocellatus]|uniref:Uncharacterized protein n=1 Tax=Plakobranchus ocellatus TaxID=259542 RepID=A0AAV3Z4W6_9GAST|nr:hypothetical protein PoB_001684900 [Plakobranchus ocellatus]
MKIRPRIDVVNTTLNLHKAEPLEVTVHVSNNTCFEILSFFGPRASQVGTFLPLQPPLDLLRSTGREGERRPGVTLIICDGRVGDSFFSIYQSDEIQIS